MILFNGHYTSRIIINQTLKPLPDTSWRIIVVYPIRKTPASLSGGSYEAAVQAAASGCEAAIGYARTASCGNRCGEATAVVRIDFRCELFIPLFLRFVQPRIFAANRYQFVVRALLNQFALFHY